MRSSNSTTTAASPARTMRKESPLTERANQFLMDPAEAAVRHQDNPIPGPVFPRQRRDDVVDRCRLARRLAACVEILYELRHRQPLRLRERAAEDRGDDDLVGGRKRLREIVLEDATARRSRPGLEHGPDPRLRLGSAQAGK